MGINESTTHNQEENAMGIEQHIEKIGIEKFLRALWSVLLAVGYVNSEEDITVDGQNYICKWPSDDHMYLADADGTLNGVPYYVTARYIFTEDIEAWEEENECEHWAGRKPRWAYCGVLEQLDKDQWADHHLEDGRYTKETDPKPF